jgi:hypothetical protein
MLSPKKLEFLIYDFSLIHYDFSMIHPKNKKEKKKTKPPSKIAWGVICPVLESWGVIPGFIGWGVK